MMASSLKAIGVVEVHGKTIHLNTVSRESALSRSSCLPLFALLVRAAAPNLGARVVAHTATFDRVWTTLLQWECPSNVAECDLPPLLRGADGIVVVYDLTRANSFEAAERWVHAARAQTQFAHPVVMMLGNKSDLANERKVHFFRAQEVSNKLGLPSFDVTQVSCLGDKTKLQESIKELCGRILGKAAPTLQIKVSVVGHVVKRESPEDTEGRREVYTLCRVLLI